MEKDIANDADFWEWLKNRNKEAQPTEQPRLEMPVYNPIPIVKNDNDTDEENRGVCVIEL